MSARVTPSASPTPRPLPAPPRLPQPSLTSLFASHFGQPPSSTQPTQVTLSSNPFPSPHPSVPSPSFTSASDLLHSSSRTGVQGHVRASGSLYSSSSSSSPPPDEARVHDLSDDAPDVGGSGEAASYATATSSSSALSTSSAASLSSLSSLLHALSNMSAYDLQSSGMLPSPGAPSATAPAATAATSPPASSQGQRPPAVAAGLRELGDDAVWTLSSSKLGNGVAQLRDGRTDTFWQSDGLSPHFISIHFAKKTKVQLLSFYVDHKLDESYTPHRIVLRGGSHSHAMRELCSLELDEPTGWITVQTLVPRQPRDVHSEARKKPKRSGRPQGSGEAQLTPAMFFSPSHPSAQLPFARPAAAAASAASASSAAAAVSYAPLRCHYLQLVILSSHQSGKDTHVREVRVYGPVGAGQEGLHQRGRGEGKENARKSHSVALLHPVFSSIEFQSTSVLR